MKKKLLIALGLLVITSSFCTSFAKVNMSSELSDAIKLYKAKNYAQSYTKLDEVLAKDSGNALAYYYKAMAATQIGRKDEAISNYDKAITLSTEGSNLNKYAIKGKNCLISPDKCSSNNYDSKDEEFIRNLKGPKFSDKVRSEYEQLKIDEMRRTINRTDDIPPAKFKEYKDFSSMNTENGTPSNDEIVAAIRVLQKAGIYNGIGNNYSDLSLLTGQAYDNSGLNMAGMSNMNPQLIQAMLMNSMTSGF